MPTPRLKPLFCAARGDRLVVSIDPRRRVEIDDPDGRVRDLLALLAEGTRGTGALASELGLPEHEIRAAVGDLDDLGWLEDAAARPVLDAGLRERHQANLAFLDGFSSLDRSSASMQERVLGAHPAMATPSRPHPPRRSFFLLDATAGCAGAPQHGRANAHARNQQRVMHDHRKVTSIASLARSMSPARNHGVTPARSR